jgi:hypothetical protein
MKRQTVGKEQWCGLQETGAEVREPLGWRSGNPLGGEDTALRPEDDGQWIESMVSREHVGCGHQLSKSLKDMERDQGATPGYRHQAVPVDKSKDCPSMALSWRPWVC